MIELGSNDAYMVLVDADVKMVAKACVKGRTNNAGQICVTAKRFIIVDSVYDEFREAFLTGMKILVVGDHTSSDTQMGPMARSDLRDGL